MKKRDAVRKIVETPPSKEVGRTSHPEAKKAGANGFVCSCLLFYTGTRDKKYKVMACM